MKNKLENISNTLAHAVNRIRKKSFGSIRRRIHRSLQKFESDISEYIESGILELYVIGDLSDSDCKDVETMATAYSEVQNEIDHIKQVLEVYAKSHAISPSFNSKAFLLARIEYHENERKYLARAEPPELHENSEEDDYSAWINQADITLPKCFKGIHAKIIGYTSEMITAIAWIEKSAPPEVHQHEAEKFFILEGSCNVTIEGLIHALNAGDFISITPGKTHHVDVTSIIPCKLILQRLAA